MLSSFYFRRASAINFNKIAIRSLFAEVEIIIGEAPIIGKIIPGGGPPKNKVAYLMATDAETRSTLVLSPARNSLVATALSVEACVQSYGCFKIPELFPELLR